MLPRSACAPIAIVLLLFAVLAVPAPAENVPPPPLRIGLSGSLSREVPDTVTLIAVRPLRAMIAAQTGFKMDFSIVAEADKLAEQVASQQLKLGIFQGVEFAWAKRKHPKLTPLVLAVNQRSRLHAYVMVRKDSTAAEFADLRDQSLAQVRGSRAHCRVFCDHQARGVGKDMNEFFSQVTTANSAEDALDQVVDGTMKAAVVDGVTLDSYARAKPGRFAELRELVKSDEFPATVIAYQAGAIDAGTLRRFRDGLLNIKQTTTAQQALLLFKLTAFEAVHADYEETVAQVGRKYPPPGK